MSSVSSTRWADSMRSKPAARLMADRLGDAALATPKTVVPKSKKDRKVLIIKDSKIETAEVGPERGGKGERGK